MKKIFNTALLTLSLILGLQFAGESAMAVGLFDPAKDDACAGSQISASAPNCDDDASGKLDSLIQSIVNILSFIIGIIAVIMIIVNGLRFITSSGDPNSVGSARNGIIYAVIGLILVGMAQFIVRFVLSRTSG